MGGADVGDHGHIRLGAAAEPFDLAEAPHPHLHHQRRCAWRRLQQGQRHAHVIVFIAAAGQHRPQGAEGGPDQFARGGLAGGAGDRHERNPQLPSPEAAQLLVGLLGVVHEPDRPTARFSQSRGLGWREPVAPGHGRHGGAVPARRQHLIEKQMTIKTFSHQRHEQLARTDATAVGADATEAGLPIHKGGPDRRSPKLLQLIEREDGHAHERYGGRVARTPGIRGHHGGSGVEAAIEKHHPLTHQRRAAEQPGLLVLELQSLVSQRRCLLLPALRQ